VRYFVGQYSESPVEPMGAVGFATLRAAREHVRRHTNSAADKSLAGEAYDDGTRHVEAYYDDHHKSSGWWITTSAALLPTPRR
jgi:hypothetical protein